MVSTYLVLSIYGPIFDDMVDNVFPEILMILESCPPSKVRIFSRQPLHDRFTSKENVFKQNTIIDHEETYYTFYGNHVELSSNLFMAFNFILELVYNF